MRTHCHPFTLIAVTLALVPFLHAQPQRLETWSYSPESTTAAGQTVTIPHTWNATDIQSGKGTDLMSKDGYRRAASWYHRDLPAATPGKRVFIRFGAVSSVAGVFLNGEKLGEHRGPSTAFALELTDKLNKSKNRLTVEADNTWRDDVAPISGDFGLPGGIYRPVEWIEKDPVCISPLHLGSRGVIVTQTEASPTLAAARVVVHLDRAVSASQQVTIDLLDADGAVASSQTKECPAGIGEAEVEGEVSVSTPRLWDGLKDPYLYTLRVSLTSSDGSKDQVKLSTGFRDIVITADGGTFLNGRPYPLRGVNRHQDRERQAWAVSDAQQREDVAMIIEIGANTVRCAHYAHSEVFLDACDRAGLLVWSELSVIDSVGGRPDAFGANAEVQLREMIAQQRHHASVFTWSIFNEIGHRPGADPVAVLSRLHQIAKSEDPSRPTSSATNQANPAFNTITDLLAFNSYPGWYGGNSGKVDAAVAKYRATAPGKPWSISEYGAGGSLTHQDDTIDKAPKPDGKWHPEAWQARVHEEALESINRHPELWGTYVWNMFDFASPWRTEGDRDGINDKGLVSYDRKTRKDAFYLYQANWSKSPVLHLLARRDDQRRIPETVIRYYTNLENVTIMFNGEKLGAAETYGPRAFIIKGVTLRPGSNLIEAHGKTSDGKPVSDRIKWTLAEAGDGNASPE